MFSSSKDDIHQYAPDFPSQSDLPNERFQALCQLVEKEGLEGLYQNLENFGIGKDLYLNKSDFLYLASLDKNVSDLIVSQANETPQIIPPSITNTIKKHPEVKEKNGEGMDYLDHANFQSWEETINSNPEITFIPKTITGLQNLVKWAQKEGKRVRASGYRHSSSEVYSDDQQILVSMIDIQTVMKLPAQYPNFDPNNEIQGIRLIGDPYEVNGKRKILCKIGSATCNYHFSDWVHAPIAGNQQWTMPLNVIMSEISFAGSNAMMCHGAGINNKTLSDLVKEIQFINVKGELQTVTDPEQLKAAAGCFGMLGLVTSLTLELDEMTYANFKTAEKKLIAVTIPPPIGTELSPQVKKNLSKENLDVLAKPEELQKAYLDFVDRCEKSYYAEWFWFPLQDKGWINCWVNNGEKSKSVRYPDPVTTDIQRTGSYLAYLGTNVIADEVPLIRKIQTKIMGDLAMLMLPDKQDITCTMQDAIHFRKGIQNFKTRMMEIDLPIPNINNSNKADWTLCQKAWWGVIESVYSPENMQYFPMRTTLEMRVMGGSDIIMAAQNQNERTCSIEILTPVAVHAERWEKFLQEILDKWSALKDDKGHFLNIRPHWAKRFDHLIINRDLSWIDEWDEDQKRNLEKYVKVDNNMISIPMRIYLKHIAYRDQLAKFMQQIDLICKAGGYEYKDIQERFSNQFLDDLLSDAAQPLLKNSVSQLPKLSTAQNMLLYKRVEQKPKKATPENTLELHKRI